MDAEAVAQAVLETVARRPEVMAAYLFGSFATGHAHALSDVDVAVLFATGASDDAIWDGTLDLNGELRAAVQHLTEELDDFVQFGQEVTHRFLPG